MVEGVCNIVYVCPIIKSPYFVTTAGRSPVNVSIREIVNCFLYPVRPYSIYCVNEC